MPALDRATFDDSRWPMLHLWLPGTLPAQGLEESLAAVSRYLLRGERFLIIIDMSRVGIIPLEQRWRLVEWLDAHKQPLRERMIGVAIIVASPVVQLSVSAVLFARPLPFPNISCPDLSSAEAWAAKRLQEEAGHTQAGKSR
ncbi:hypothetical protein JQX13_24210 [Archangium violaceum]|uniref:hypothetical protein n=1 Tax=Archangium violaceum TaxID=83451 RepID=UPI00193C14C3|nr:hypothetical protein [Archangium violaceum]QRK12861.1 hypothetical protein JQX13_24210 [Archangium violaceum]